MFYEDWIVLSIGIFLAFATGFLLMRASVHPVLTGGQRVVGLLSPHTCGISVRKWRALKGLAETRVMRRASWSGEGGPIDRSKDGFVSFDTLQAEIMDLWKKGVEDGLYPHPNSYRARSTRLFLWVTGRRRAT